MSQLHWKAVPPATRETGRGSEERDQLPPSSPLYFLLSTKAHSHPQTLKNELFSTVTSWTAAHRPSETWHTSYRGDGDGGDGGSAGCSPGRQGCTPPTRPVCGWSRRARSAGWSPPGWPTEWPHRSAEPAACCPPSFSGFCPEKQIHTEVHGVKGSVRG